MRSAAVIALAPVGATFVVVASAASFTLFDWLTRENSVLEWLQVFLLLTTMAMLFLLALRMLAVRELRFAFVFALAALAVLFVAGEELSWGQSIFDWGTPSTFREKNFQGETNVHNLENVHSSFIYGFILAGLYGVFAPFV